MTQLQIICRIPPEQAQDHPLAEGGTIDRDMLVALCDHDPEQATMTVFQGKELPDLIAGINLRLKEQQESSRLPEDTQELSLEQAQSILNFAASLGWKHYRVTSEIGPGWQQELQDVQLLSATPTKEKSMQQQTPPLSHYQRMIHELDPQINPAGVEAP